MGADHDRIARKLKANTIVHNRDTLISCHTDDKCYCSLGEQSSTTWCDTDSCISTTKCYCKHKSMRPTQPTSAITKNANRNCITDSLALDYELFTVNNCSRTQTNGTKHVRSQEALSVKKSVEMAAVFADVKLSQTTDIRNMGGPTSSEEDANMRNNRRNNSNSSRAQSKKSGGSTRSKSSVIPNVTELNPIFRKNTQKINEMYQTISPRVVSATLEDSLGYLP